MTTYKVNGLSLKNNYKHNREKKNITVGLRPLTTLTPEFKFSMCYSILLKPLFFNFLSNYMYHFTSQISVCYIWHCGIIVFQGTLII